MKTAKPFGAICLAATAAFFPMLGGAFLNWDDQTQLLDNAQLQGLDLPRLWWMWTQPWFGNYHPLTWMSYAANFTFFGAEPLSFHVANLLLHLANAALIFLLARRFLVGSWAAAAAAGFFALHPLRVESVAWISARGNLLSAFFLLLSLWWFLESEGKPRRPSRRLWAVAAFAASLFAKAWAVTLPLLFLVLDVFPLKNLPSDPRRWPAHGALWRRRAVFWILSAAFAASAIWAKSGVRDGATDGALDRLWTAGVAVFFYVAKTVWPAALSPFYEHPAAAYGAWLCLGAVLAVAALTGASFFYFKKFPGAAALWWAFLILLAPILGLASVGVQWAADRYTYLAAAPWAFGFGWLWSRGGNHAHARRAALAAVLALFGFLSHRYAKAWNSSEALWSWALRANPASPMAHNMLAGARQQAGDFADAEKLYREVLEARPQNVKAILGLAEVAEAKRDFRAALGFYEKAALLHAANLEALEGAGRAAFSLGDAALAFQWMGRAVAIAPHSWTAQCTLGAAALQLKNYDAAAAALGRAERLYPISPDVQNNLGILALARGQGDVARAHFQRADELGGASKQIE